jgi:hypothetical protein
MAERFTWTYGASEGRTIFINDNNLQDPKGNGIAAITCHQIGKEEAERLAKLWVASSDLLEACKESECLLGNVNFLYETEPEQHDVVENALLKLRKVIDRARGKDVVNEQD